MSKKTTSLALSSEHLSFFREKHYIAFDEIIQETTARELKAKLDKSLCERLSTPLHLLMKKPNIDLFTAAYDLQLVDDHLNKFLRKPKFNAIAKELFQTPILRLAFSQYLTITSDSNPPFLHDLPFEATSCLGPLVGLLLINLGDVHGLLAPFSLPQQIGSALFLSPSTPFPWKDLFSIPHTHFLLIGFGKENTFFKEGTQDPLAYELKKLGYYFNDMLREPLHPLLK